MPRLAVQRFAAADVDDSIHDPPIPRSLKLTTGRHPRGWIVRVGTKSDERA